MQRVAISTLTLLTFAGCTLEDDPEGFDEEALDTPRALLGQSCVDPSESCSALALFEPATSDTSLLWSLDDYPGSTDFLNTPPTNSQNTWVMGDWNGDGEDTPGYYGGGKFRYTNDTGPTQNWSAHFQLSPANEPNRPLVAGRFLDNYANDCIGVINSTPHPGGVDTIFILNYWCSMESPPQDPQGDGLLGLYLGAILPDSQFSGTHQFVAGDWDGDDIDEIAVRKGQFITYTTDNPLPRATFPTAQKWGTPESEPEHDGLFVGGDWNGDGIDGWGVVYTDNRFYYRNNLAWNPGSDAYHLQNIDNTFSERQVSSHHNDLP